MTETEGRRKKEVPLVTWQQKRPSDGTLNGQPYTWAAIKENPDKPQQIQGWKRVPKTVEPPSTPVQPASEERIQSWRDAVSPEDAAEERMRGIIQNQNPPKPEEK